MLAERNEHLRKTLGIERVISDLEAQMEGEGPAGVPVVRQAAEAPAVVPVGDLTDELTKAKTNLDDLYAQGREVLGRAAENIDIMTKAGEVTQYSQLLTTLVALQSKVVDVVEKIDEKRTGARPGGNTVNNNLFIGNPGDINELMARLKAGPVVDVQVEPEVPGP